MQTGGSEKSSEPIGPCSRRITKERQRRHDPKKSRPAADHDKILGVVKSFGAILNLDLSLTKNLPQPRQVAAVAVVAPS